MDDTQLLEQVKKLLASTPKVDQAKSFGEVQRWLDNLPKSSNVASAQPFITDPKQLADSGMCQQFEDLAKEFIATDNEDQALKARRLLEDFLLAKNPNLRIGQPDLYERYLGILVLFKFVSLPIRPLREIDELLQNNLVFALSWGIDLHDKLDQVLFANDDILNNGEIAFRLGKDFLSCKEFISDKDINFSGENKLIKPTVGHWVKDYLSFNLDGQRTDRDAFQQISYLTKNKNVLQLDVAGKRVLSEIIRLYDWLAFGIYETGEEEPSPVGTNKYITSNQFTLPSETQKTPPVVPAPKNAPILKPISEIRPPVNQPKAPAPNIVVRPPIEILESDLPKTAAANNVQEILRKREQEFHAGLKLGSTDQASINRVTLPNNPPQSVNREADKPAFAKASEGKQEEIDKKLKELDERMGKNK